MDVQHLQILRELRERGSVTAVASAMHVSPSAVSQQLATLQRSVGVPLTRKDGRRLVLTDAGDALADAAVNVMSALESARSAVDDHLDDRESVVSIAALQSVAALWFPALLAAFDDPATGPGLRLSDEDVSLEDFPRLVADYDIVLAHRLSHSPAWSRRGVAVIPLMHEPLDIAMAATHPLARKSSVGVRDLVDQSWIAVHAGFPLEPAIDALAAAAGRPLAIVHRINDFAVARACLAVSHDVALMPRHLAAPPPESNVVLRPLTGITLGRDIDLLARPDILQRRAVRLVVGQLRAFVSEMVSRP
jgi:DNA-binding transcriptional LysR family regulator